MSMTALRLHEEILLLALRDREGTTPFGVSPEYALAGAMLAELLLAGRVRIAEKPRFVEVESSTPVGDPLLDECLDRMATARRRARAESWIGRFATMRKLTHRVAERLVERGVLRADSQRVLLLFRQRTFPEVDPRPEREILARLENAIFIDDPVEPRTAVLAVLAKVTNLLQYSFPKERLKERTRRLEDLGSGSAIGAATADAVAAMQAAVMVATMVPVFVATTT